MWSVWGVAVVLMAGLHVYRESLTRNEEDQVYLDEAFDHEKNAQAAIVDRVNKIEPALNIAKWASAVLTVFVIAYYIRDILAQLRIL
jgi:hypothetical protein